MNVWGWVSGLFSDRGKALSLYRRGMRKAKKQDHRGAIEDYTATIGMADLPADVRGMVLYNRALMYVATGDERKGTEDLEAVLALKESLGSIKTMARQKLFRMEAKSQKCELEKHG